MYFVVVPDRQELQEPLLGQLVRLYPLQVLAVHLYLVIPQAVQAVAVYPEEHDARAYSEEHVSE